MGHCYGGKVRRLAAFGDRLDELGRQKRQPHHAAQGSATLSYAYDSAGRLSSMTLPNGVVVAYSYDAGSRIAAIAYSNGSGSLGNLSYSYDADGRTVGKGGSLASIVMPQPVSGNTFNAANEMQNFGGQPLAYDTDGNLLGDGTNSYTWDARNQLASLAGPTSASFAYDAFGRRVGQTITGALTGYLYDLANAGMPLQEFSSTGAPLLSGLGASRVDLSGTMTFLSDAQNNTIALTDNTGAIQTQYSCGPFGAVSITGAASTNPYQFGDMQNDGTGLYYASGGYYSATFGLGIGGSALATGASQNASSSGNGSCDKCRAQLKYHPVDYPLISDIANHAFWDVHMADDGSPGTIYSGQSSKYMDGTYHLNDWGYLARYEWADNSPAPPHVSDNKDDDTSYDSFFSSDLCQACHLLDYAASFWPQGQITYWPAWGPNSNTLANHLGLCGGFPDGPPPLTTGKGGWDNPVAQQVPCL